jgi:hypothetical protein
VIELGLHGNMQNLSLAVPIRPPHTSLPAPATIKRTRTSPVPGTEAGLESPPGTPSTICVPWGKGEAKGGKRRESQASDEGVDEGEDIDYQEGETKIFLCNLDVNPMTFATGPRIYTQLAQKNLTYEKRTMLEENWIWGC